MLVPRGLEEEFTAVGSWNTQPHIGVLPWLLGLGEQYAIALSRRGSITNPMMGGRNETLWRLTRRTRRTVGRWRWLQVERRFGMDGVSSISSRAAQEGEEELPSPPVDAWSLMGEHAGLESQNGLTVAALRGASEHLAGVLTSWPSMSET